MLSCKHFSVWTAFVGLCLILSKKKQTEKTKKRKPFCAPFLKHCIADRLGETYCALPFTNSQLHSKFNTFTISGPCWLQWRVRHFAHCERREWSHFRECRQPLVQGWNVRWFSGKVQRRRILHPLHSNNSWKFAWKTWVNHHKTSTVPVLWPNPAYTILSGLVLSPNFFPLSFFWSKLLNCFRPLNYILPNKTNMLVKVRDKFSFQLPEQ